MSVSNEELLKSIRHYQESLEKYSSIKNNYKLLDIIKKLKRLPIATSHLENTGIGRTVNALRKLGGEIGDAAKSLVSRWKEMVLEEEEKAKREAQEESVNTASSTDNDVDNYESSEEMVVDIEEVDQSKSSHKSSDTEKKSSDKYKEESDKYSSSNRKSNNKGNHMGDGESSSKKRRHEYRNDNDERSTKKRHASTSSESEEETDEDISKPTPHRRHRSESSEDDEDRKHKVKKSKYHSDHSSSDEKEHKRSSGSNKSHSSSSKSSEKTDNRRHDHESQRKDEKSKSKHKSETKSTIDSDCEEVTSSKQKNKKDSRSVSEETKSKSKHESKSRHEKESSKSKDSKSHSSRLDKHETSKKESKFPESHSHRKDEAKRSEDKYKKSKSDKESARKDKSSSKSEENGKSSGSTKHKSSSEKKKDKDKVKAANSEKKLVVNSIDSGSGASFADALGMCEPPRSSKSTVTKKKKSSSGASVDKPRASSSYSKSEQYEEEDEDIVPNLLKQEPSEPLNLNISSLLPEISPHYKPLGLPLDSQPRRLLTPDEALSQAISNKNMRTKVYSGNKTYGKLESLFDLCVRVLQDNIDALEYTGGVPYLILKPILEKATPDQLFNMEHHNPYLIEDTDELWHLHCQKEFRTKKREELESWREMYMRCLDEREARLNAITANIKQSQDKSIPVRTTKLAYVDSVVKPPRNVLRKQVKNGMIFDKRPAQTPASRLSALATSGEAGKVAVPNPGGRAVDRSSSGSSSAAALKPKKAPLMAKTLSLFKNRFRR